MDRKLHELILEAASVAEKTDHTHVEVAEAIGMDRNHHRRWRNRDLRQEGGYQAHEKDEERIRSLTSWLQSAPDADSLEQAYGGPADAKQDPQVVASEEIGGYGTGNYGHPEPPEPKVSGHTAGKDMDREEIVGRQRDLYERRRRKERSKQRRCARFEYGPITLAFQGDEHYGASGCDVDHALRDAEVIAQTPGMYAVKVGDFVDNFITAYLEGKNAKTSVQVEEQWECARHHLDILSGSVLAVVAGNHDNWTRLLTHLDPVREMLGDRVLYDPNEVTFRVKVGHAEKEVFLRHGYSKGHSQWNETHQLEKAAKFTHPGHDIYVSGHTHSGLHLKVFAKRGGGYGAAVQTDSYKKFDEYGDRQGYSDYPKEEVAGALTIHEDGTLVPHMSLDRASDYMTKFY
jgi:predicted phosphodiesterase